MACRFRTGKPVCSRCGYTLTGLPLRGRCMGCQTPYNQCCPMDSPPPMRRPLWQQVGLARPRPHAAGDSSISACVGVLRLVCVLAAVIGGLAYAAARLI